MNRLSANILRRVLASVALGAAVLAAAFLATQLLAPIELDRPPTPLTGLQLQLLRSDPARCFATLDHNRVDYERAAPLQRDDGCGYQDAAHLERSSVRYGSRVLLRCPAMVGLLLWERQVLQPAAEQHFGRSLASLRHLGTYSCRSIGRRRGVALSQHAYANAIDVAGFQIQGGPTLSIARDWKDEGSPGGRFLRDVRDGACRIFGIVLSPDHNRAHADHLHLDMSLADVCR